MTPGRTAPSHGHGHRRAMRAHTAEGAPARVGMDRRRGGRRVPSDVPPRAHQTARTGRAVVDGLGGGLPAELGLPGSAVPLVPHQPGPSGLGRGLHPRGAAGAPGHGRIRCHPSLAEARAWGAYPYDSDPAGTAIRPLARPFGAEGRVTRGDRAWLAGSLALSTAQGRAAYLRQAPEHELAGAPETDLRSEPDGWPRRFSGNSRQPLLAGGRLELDHQFGRHPAAVFHLDALRLGPLADLGGVQAARRSPAATAGGRRAPPPARRAAPT